LVGRAQPVRIFEPLAAASDASGTSDGVRAFAARWSEALSLYRAREFGRARDAVHVLEAEAFATR